MFLAFFYVVDRPEDSSTPDMYEVAPFFAEGIKGACTIVKRLSNTASHKKTRQ